MKKTKLLVIFLLLSQIIYAQKIKKSILIKLTDEAPRIDGVINDNAWKKAEIASGFFMYAPGYGDAEPENQKTLVRVLYNHEAIFIAATLYDPNPQSIPMQFTTRDNFGQSDTFTVSINPFNDAINDIRFHVMSTGTQADLKISTEGADFSWNAVWQSAVSFDNKAWYVEMKIPYSALRFPTNSKNDWGINFYRNIRLTNEKYSWNFIDTKKGQKSDYSGLLKGIRNINPPLRLSLYPYAQGSVKAYNGDNNWAGTAGLDLKYGIDESFTLDVTLIPDFGQTEFDDLVVNLGPFEQQYEEKRSFFTEGTELFTKGDLFYSRRIGKKSILHANDSLEENEIVSKENLNAKMLNATKLTGRTKDGLGVGFFNAITVAKASLLDTLTNDKRKIITDPFTNYNIMVLDQTFNENSSYTIINTNVIRKGSYTNANVTSAIIDYHTNNNKYAIKTDLSTSSRIKDYISETGFKANLKLNQNEGAHRFGTELTLSDSFYNKNDLGIQEYNNFVTYEASYRYRTFKPIGIYNKLSVQFWSFLEYRYKPYTYTDNGIGIAAWGKTKKQLIYGTNLNVYLGYKNDYYEPGTEERFVKIKQMQYANFWIQTNSAKKLKIRTSLTAGTQFNEENPQTDIYFNFRPRYRFNNRFQISYSLDWIKDTNVKGHVDDIEEDDIIFGNREEKTLVNSLKGSYHISTKSALSLAFRHYWIQATYDSQLFSLQKNGSLLPTDFTPSDYNYNENVNFWNLDLNYTWQFAPGSQMVVQYKNDVFSYNSFSQIRFNKNLKDLFDNPMRNQLSLKLIYFLDYNNFKKMK